jgi:hypothetical protein
LKTKINQILDNTIRELDEIYLGEPMGAFLRDLDRIVLSSMLNDTGIKLVKKLVTDHQELVLDYTVMFIANMSIEGITAADLKKVTNAATQAFTYARTLDENMRKLLKVDELVTNDNIAVVLFLTKLNIKRVINLVNECKQK